MSVQSPPPPHMRKRLPWLPPHTASPGPRGGPESRSPAPLSFPPIPGARRPEVSGTREVKAYGVGHTPREGGQGEERSPGFSQSGPKVDLTLNRPPTGAWGDLLSSQ